MSAPRLLLLVLLLLLALGCGKVKSTINPSDADLFNKEWEALRERGSKPSHPIEAPGAATELLFQELTRLDELLDAGPLGALASQEQPNTKAELSAWLKQLEPLFEELTAMLSEPLIQEAIMKGTSLAQRPSIRFDMQPPNRFASPSLQRSLRLVRPLCARAVFCALANEDSNGCIRNLVQALDLIQLLHDGSLLSLKRSAVLGSEVLGALQTLLPRSKLPPDFLRSQIEPRLALACSPGKLELTMHEETIYRMAIGRSVVLNPGLPANEFGLKYLDCEPDMALQRCLEFLAFDKSIRIDASICNLVAQEKARGILLAELGAIEEFHNFEIACHLARLALALNEHEWQKGSWPNFMNELEGYAGDKPISPCSARRVEYRLDFNGIRLVSFDRASRTQETDIPLHLWTWSKQDLSELNARR